MSPLFGAMGVELEVRNAAKDRGYQLAGQMMCAHDMLGGDEGLDFLFLGNFFVMAEAVDAEHMVRRALLGKNLTIVSITEQDGMDKNAMLKRYARAGLTVGTVFEDAPPELGLPRGFKYWFPEQDERHFYPGYIPHTSYWGVPDDGFCHLTTRSGSAPVVNRNWHWGPKLHQTYADAYALLFSLAARLAIDELSAGRTAPEPPKTEDVGVVLTEEEVGIQGGKPPTWKQLLYSDMRRDEAVSAGLRGVRCAVGLTNQAGATLLPHWLRPANGSPFEEKMKARNGVGFVPSDHTAKVSNFYKVTSTISSPNEAVDVGNWVENPGTFGAEAPRTAEQCNHADGSTLLDFSNKPEGVSWLVWEVPKSVVSIGRAMICPAGNEDKNKFGVVGIKDADAFNKGDIRSHYAVPDGKGGWKILEDAHKSMSVTFARQECTPLVDGMDGADLEAAKEGGMWVAVEAKAEAAINPYYLVAM